MFLIQFLPTHTHNYYDVVKSYDLVLATTDSTVILCHAVYLPPHPVVGLASKLLATPESQFQYSARQFSQ